MNFDERIELVMTTCEIRDGQSIERETTRREVWAAKKSVTRSEYYKAAQAGIRTDAIFCVHSAEYGGELRVIHGGERFDVVRTYGAETETMELTCRRRLGA